MSDKRSNSGYSPNRIDTLIGAGTQVAGNIACSGVLRVQGDVRGDVSCRQSPSGALIIDSAGSVTGTTDAPHVVVRGRMVGPTHSSRSIEIHQGATLVGDVSFNEIAIHSGGILEGELKPCGPTAIAPQDSPEESAAPRADARAVAVPEAGRSGGRRKLGVAAIVAVAVVGVVGAVWLGNRPAVESPAEATAPAASVAQKTPAAAAGEPRRDSRAAVVEAVVPEASPAPPPPAPDEPERSEEAIKTVRGANPNRPSGVFLLVTHEAAILYKKQRDEAGAGTRITTTAGEKVSVTIAPDELVRVAKGRAVDIFFQGQKVGRQLIENGSWLSFVPRSAGEPDGQAATAR